MVGKGISSFGCLGWLAWIDHSGLRSTANDNGIDLNGLRSIANDNGLKLPVGPTPDEEESTPDP